ncbi:hypothetical protein CHUAL_003559 [Chamberlinius hualienensis]
MLHCNELRKLFDRTALGFFLVVFRLYGFRFDTYNVTKMRNIAVIVFHLTTFLLMFGCNIYYIYATYAYSPTPLSVTLKVLPFEVTDTFKLISLVAAYLNFFKNVKRWGQLLRRLAIDIDRTHDQISQVRVIKRIKRCVIWGIVAFLSLTFQEVVALFHFYMKSILKVNKPDDFAPSSVTHMVVFGSIEALYSLTINSFWNWMNITVLIISELIIIWIELYLKMVTSYRQLSPEALKIGIKVHQISHQTLTKLMKNTEYLISDFLMLSLIKELLYVTTVIKLLSEIGLGSYSIFYLFTAFTSAAMLFIRSVALSKVNEKVKPNCSFF